MARETPLPVVQPRGRGPFASLAPSLAFALVYLLALFGWLAFGDQLPGGRWMGVHLFTVGVLTNVVLAFSEHFSRTVTRTPGDVSLRWVLVANVGIALTLFGLPAGLPLVLALGSMVILVAVSFAYVRLRRMRQGAVGARFSWVVRTYERAHSAFIHGALIGALLGTGLITGAWYSAGRIAHLHVNVLGWGGLTLLGTLVFFGPTMARTRIEPGADAAAARAIKLGSIGLSVAFWLLIISGIGEPAGTVLRLGAAGGLAALAVAASVVCLPVFRAVRAAKPGASKPLILGVCAWFPFVVWADVLVVATGAWEWLGVLGVIALAGVLGRAILATLLYLAPMLRAQSFGTRELVRARLDRGARLRAGVIEAALLGLVISSLPGASLPWLSAVGWAAIGLVVVLALIAVLLPIQEPDGQAAI